MAYPTPGPWELRPWVESLGGCVYRTIAGAGRQVSSVSVYGKKADGTVAGRALKGGGHTKTVSVEECDANARLIAAAPDLYAALYDLTRWVEDHYANASTHNLPTIVASAKETLAKAVSA